MIPGLPEDLQKEAEQLELDVSPETCAAIPPRLRLAFLFFAITGRMPGGFATAVLKNNLLEACAAADDQNVTILPLIVRYVHNVLPGPCWGTPEKVQTWNQQGGSRGRAAAAALEALGKK